MYFMVENTPESVKRQRRAPAPEPEPAEERPCLSLAPFSRPPLVLFENVPIGSCAERHLDVVNPTKKSIQLAVGRAPPPGLAICLPESQLEVAPQQGCSVTLRWSPLQPIAQRETIHFTDQYRGRYDVILVLKTVIIKTSKKMRARKSPPKKIGIISPNPRISKPTNKKVSPKLLTKKKFLSNYQTTRIQQFVTETLVSTSKAPSRMYSDKENVSPQYRQNSPGQRAKVCPFESLASINSGDSFNFNTLTSSDMFAMKETEYYNYSQNVSGIHKFEDEPFPAYAPASTHRHGILEPSTHYNTDTVANAIENLTFTPLKGIPSIKINKSPTNFCNAAYENEFVDSIEAGKKIDNETHSIILIKSHDENDLNSHFLQAPSHPVPRVRPVEFNFSVDEDSSIQSKKIPNTSSPKQYSPAVNFTMNTEYSHITDTTFFPQRCSTERKATIFSKGFHGDNFIETPDVVEKTYRRLSSDTYTKPDSPNVSIEPIVPKAQSPPYVRPFIEPLTKQSSNPRQLVFNERPPPQLMGRKGRNCGDGVRGIIEANLWQPDKSPPRSMTPPLQSIPEESTRFSVSQYTDQSNTAFNTFTINRTFDKPQESFAKPRDSISSWQKRSVRCEPNLWKQPLISKEITGKNETKSMQVISESFNDISTNSALHHIGNVYAQASTVDPFLSSTYFYDEEAVDGFEKEFKRWLNYILTPPADLESNLDDQAIDVSKMWTENRNKEIPLAPTREQVSSKYHNNHRLESVRKSARALMLSSNMTEVFRKLNVQIDRKLIGMRPDKNLFMDVGLQKIIIGLLLCYNPLWLRVGLETLYGTVIPLASNSDVFGLTTFIVQRLFKDPYAKSKHSNPQLPNMLLPSYVDYMRKFTLKKYFMLVFFLDQAKQKKLITHDPCLFCRTALYKESRELLIQFTKELIGGIGDITKHLRPLGYVVSHKQSYLDEYKYAVHNLAVDLKDGIRLSRVMEIILVKPGLMSYMRTPPVSRLQKIHNVQVALTALKNSDFNIVGDITARDIADGHREKTLSLLWQLIHVFRAPLFEKASIVIQMWWKKKYLGIAIEKRIQHKKKVRKDNAASVIQCWWRIVQYQRLVDKNMKELQAASLVVQKYWRMWMCRSKYLKYKSAARKIEMWYISAKQIKQAEEILKHLLLQQRSVARIQMWYRRLVRARKVLTIRHLYMQYCAETKIRIQAADVIKQFWKRKLVLRKFRNVVFAAINAHKIYQLRNNAATTIQSAVRRWLCHQRYTILKQKVIICQAAVRGYLVRRQSSNLLRRVIFIQRTFRNKMLMVKDKSSFTEIKHATVVLQSRYKMLKQRRYYLALKQNVLMIENRYVALLKMRSERRSFLQLKANVITVQKYRRALVARRNYMQKRQSVICLQRRYRAHLAMKMQRQLFTNLKNSTLNIEIRYIALIKMREQRNRYIQLKMSAVVIQKYFRAAIARRVFMKNRLIVINVQRRYRANIAMKKQKNSYFVTKQSATVIQRYFRSYCLMKSQREYFVRLRSATITIQRFVRAVNTMRKAKKSYNCLKNAATTIQRHYRAQLSMKKALREFITLKQACKTIQTLYRALKAMREQKGKFNTVKMAAISIQQIFRANKSMKRDRQQYLKLKQCIMYIQRMYRAKLLRRECQLNYAALKRACITVQKLYRAKLLMRCQRNYYLNLKLSTIFVQKYYRANKLRQVDMAEYMRIKHASLVIQRRFRAHREMTRQRSAYLKLHASVVVVQRRYRANRAMKCSSNQYQILRYTVINIQQRFRANRLMNNVRNRYLEQKTAADKIKMWYIASTAIRKQRYEYLQVIRAVKTIQQRYRAWFCMLKTRNEYLQLKWAANVIQAKYRAKRVGHFERQKYLVVHTSLSKIQCWYRSIKHMRLDRMRYIEMKAFKLRSEAATKIQVWYRAILSMRKTRGSFLRLRQSIITIQASYRMYTMKKAYVKIRNSAVCIQRFYRAYHAMQIERQKFLRMRAAAVKIQSVWRCWHIRQVYLIIWKSVLAIQVNYRRRKWLQDLREKQQSKIQAVTCIQKYFKRYLCMKEYRRYREKVIFVQRQWRQMLQARRARESILEKERNSIVRVQALARGHLARQRVKGIRRELMEQREQQRQHRAASKIQALFRGNRVREQMKHYPAVAELRQKLIRAEPVQREDTIRSQNDYALDVLTHYRDIPSIIRAFVIIEYLTEVYPMIYHKTGNRVAVSLLNYMMMTNRSVSTLDTVRPAAAILVNMARYKHTALVIYSREKMANVLKLIMRWSSQDSKYYCALCTFFWLFGKYDHIRKDLTQFLHEPENRNMMHLIREGVLRKQRMKDNAARYKTFTPKPVKTQAKCSAHLNVSCRTNCGVPAAATPGGLALPALEPDYGFRRPDKPRYFEHDLHAIDSLFTMYHIPLK